MNATCNFCERPLAPSEQKNRQFCNSSCRANFHSGRRRLGEDLFRTGAVDSGTIRLHARKDK